MLQMMPEVRNVPRAVIVRDNKLLVLRKQGDDAGHRFALPGGGIHPGESLEQALIRECEEEIGTRIAVGPLLHVADLFRIRSRQPDCQRHVVEFLFLCEVAPGYQPVCGSQPDKRQIGVEWVDGAILSQLTMSPAYLAECLPPDKNLNCYLGTFHEYGAAQKR